VGSPRSRHGGRRRGSTLKAAHTRWASGGLPILRRCARPVAARECCLRVIMSAGGGGEQPAAAGATSPGWWDQRHCPYSGWSGLLSGLPDHLAPGMAPKTCSIVRIFLLIRAPLRNRTVDLLLTMNRRTVMLSLAGGVTRQNTSTDQHPQAPDRLPLALFATQSATQFDLQQGRSPPGSAVSLRRPGRHVQS
jgi:hypothetical protein